MNARKDDRPEGAALSAPAAARCPIDFDYLGRVLGIDSPEKHRAVLDVFWDATRETNAELTKLADGHDLAGLKLAAHSAMGAALYVGARSLGEHLEKLEALAAANDREACKAQMAKVTAEFARVEEFMRSEGLIG